MMIYYCCTQYIVHRYSSSSRKSCPMKASGYAWWCILLQAFYPQAVGSDSRSTVKIVAYTPIKVCTEISDFAPFKNMFSGVSELGAAMGSRILA
jgi:hypothetical protein